MATAVASRFAVLPIEDDDDEIPQKSKNQKKKKVEPKQKPVAPAPKADNASVKKKKKKKPDQGEGKKKASNEQWEQWKQKDNEFVDESYEQDLQQAILLSKLDFEEKKKFYDRAKKEEEDKKGKKKEKKKAQPMSLEKFNSLDAEQIENIATGSSSQETEEASGPVEPDQTFFDRVVEDAKKVIDREQRLELCKAREPLAQEAVTITHYKDLLKERDKELASLKEEVETLKEELLNSKKRYKKFCNLLASAEMCDKAKVVAEVDRLHKVRDELSAEVSSLHAQLEQERSKVRQLTSELKKTQNKKRTTSETAP
ncbi:G kinase-anchoring protein 1-like isoform X1 [Ischnura elegans]|uniref:G kinase-anchoring protein 1-like isoform X1 n=1 Tax=Ischnura elegans TaxID=197161 RepID=UPI001ED88F8D|nr:G kinase-anchoring protein 1-like isoform X1 [Ischnura elegans]XP_046401018.1 G kinase-anchoring protein 1-like isoform X1 [Ischnura elegans]